MKRIANYLLLTLLLASCGNKSASSGKEISLRMRSGEKRDYLLLAVRDSSIVVFPLDEIYDERISVSHAQIIKNDSIAKITIDGIFAPIIIGSWAGTLFGLAAAEVIPHKNQIIKNVEWIAPPFKWYLIPAETIAGIVIAFLATSGDYSFKPHDTWWHRDLRAISYYPNGEPQLLKLVR